MGAKDAIFASKAVYTLRATLWLAGDRRPRSITSLQLQYHMVHRDMCRLHACKKGVQALCLRR